MIQVCGKVCNLFQSFTPVRNLELRSVSRRERGKIIYHTNIPRRPCYQGESQAHKIQDQLIYGGLLFDRSKGLREAGHQARDSSVCTLQGRIEINVHLLLSATSLVHEMQNDNTYPIDLSKRIEDEHCCGVIHIVTLNDRRTAIFVCGQAAVHVLWAIEKVADASGKCKVFWRLVGSPV
ncbi:hypothetical protein CC80DRAFT_79935 [Byssothecium circinans]|uniref:Uncharacterized protein n=1 Tax=Byssothecium circinans TaxID=147558 RepID=A0A6A5TYQ3_9PLEO|nr:hypothetical protein CC80DRAFT_79935 [Byssothecium circinans]